MPSDNVWMIKLFERRLTLTQHFHVTSSFSKIKIINPSVVVVSSDVRPSRNRLRFSVTFEPDSTFESPSLCVD